jgi:hypothetical protein
MFEERHEREQYFFDEPTIGRLVDVLVSYRQICTLCAPLLGKALAARGQAVTILDIDERFSNVPGFQCWDLQRPTRLAQRFDLIICDPPFFTVSLSRIFRALRVLAQERFDQALLVAYLCRRESAVLGTFRPFALVPTAAYPSYLTVQPSQRNAIAFYGNLSSEVHAALAAACPQPVWE